ncbi:glycosyltransferase [Aequorivita sp. CIP111184]|uniref:glycosyltransferase n=1 Tax=Aequorivita sp. CIP111184 TaxID=2211356 RepID=UPI000DBBB54C|nr:glycosyltransferase [Aequorivita sp. CIP111184]SRX54896.1 N-acetylgalactosamine-N, N'-diacetylbacillosaminyl-diphospho-undecaprenol 4-alpha-N-acetylgalactosaminyltransferase [Aequorivita sp. CIP111184]
MSHKKKILIVLPNDNLGGAEQFLKLLGDYFKEKKVASVFVIFFKKRKSGAWDKSEFISYYGASNKERYGVFNVIKSIYKLRHINFDYTFTSHIHTNGLVGLMRRLNVLKTKYHVGRESTSTFSRFDGLKLKIFKTQYRYGYPGLDLLICQSELMKEQLINGISWIKKATKIEVIGNPLDLEKIKTLALVKINKIMFDGPYIVSAGRLIPEKGYEILIESFAILHFDFPDYKLVIFGEGLLRNKLEGKIADLGLKHKILMPGFVDNIYPYFREAKLCVVSSRIEGFPNVLLQMMSQNTNVVSTKCAGGIENLKGVYVSETNDVNDLATQMEKCLVTDNTKNRKLFDDELDTRSVESFVSKIDFYLNEA